MKYLFLILFLLIPTFKVKAQSVDISTIKINEKLSFGFSFNELIKSGIKVDSITVIPNDMDMSQADSLVYIGYSNFEYFISRNYCETNSIYFDERNLNLTLNEFNIDGSLTSVDIQKIFPDDCKKVYPLTIYNDDNYYESCSLPVRTDNGDLIEMKLILIFLDEKIYRIDFWWPS